VAAAATKAGTTEDPLKAVIAAINGDGRKVAVPTNIRVSSNATIIKTDYSRIEMLVTEVTDLTAQIIADPKLQQSFYDTFDAVSASALKDITPTNLRDKCGAFANTLGKNYSFSKKDSSFIFGYVGQNAYPADIDDRLDCIGNKYNAIDVVDFKFPYNRNYGSLKEFTKLDVDNHFAGLGFRRTLLNSSFARNYMTRLSNPLSIYSQLPADNSGRLGVWTALSKAIGADPLALDDLTGVVSVVDPVDMGTQQVVAKLNDLGFKRFGCYFIRPTVGAGAYDAIVLALPLSVPAGRTNGYELGDVIGLRLIIDATGKPDDSVAIKKVQVTNDELALYEAANENKGQCPSGGHINLSPK
jgi:hypothetical protein